jgi:hypothetical protein
MNMARKPSSDHHFGGRFRLESWPVLPQHVTEWIQDAKRVAVSCHRQVLEDGPDVCDSESDSENSDHGEMSTYTDMYTSEMLGPDGKPKAGPQHLMSKPKPGARVSEQRQPTHASAKISGGAGGQDTVGTPG